MAKRVNKRFLVILTVVVVGMLGAAVVGPPLARRIFRDRHAMASMLAAEKAAAEARTRQTPAEIAECLRAARQHYSDALRGSKGGVDLYLKAAEVSYQLTRYDADEIGKHTGLWEAALEIDPSCRPALERLIEEYPVRAALSPSLEIYERLRLRARALLEVDPGNLTAEMHLRIHPVGTWLAGLASDARDTEPGGRRVGRAAIEEAVERLREMLPRAAVQGYGLMYVGRARIRLAQERVTANDATNAVRHANLAREAVEAAVGAFPKDPAVGYRAYEILRTVAELPSLAIDVPSEEGGVRLSPEQREAAVMKARAAIVERAREILFAVRQHVSVDDPFYTDIELSCIHESLMRGDLDRGQLQERLQALLAMRPDDLQVRTVLARVWRRDTTRRQAAIDLLADLRDDAPELIGFRALTKRAREVQAVEVRAQLRLDAYLAAEAAERPALRAAIDRDLGLLARSLTEQHPTVLKLQATLLAYDGRFSDAIPMLQRAVDAPAFANLNEGDRVEALELLARLYDRVGQTRETARILTSLVQLRPQVVEWRIHLAQLLIADRQLERAVALVGPLLDSAERDEQTGLPRDRNLVQFALIRLVVNKEEAKAVQLLRKLPEETPEQRLFKAGVAMTLEKADLARELLQPLVREDPALPTTVAAAQGLAQLYIQQGRHEEALTLVREMLKARPDVSDLVDIERRLARRAQPLTAADIEQIPDPVERAIEGANLLIQQEKYDAAYQRLLAAEPQAGGNPRFLEYLFGLALRKAGDGEIDLPVAQRCLEALSALNHDRVQGGSYRVRLLIAQDRYDEAIAEATRLTRDFRELARAWVALGQAQQVNRQLEAAVKSYEQALQLKADSIEAIEGLVQCRLAMGQLELARKAMEVGVAVNNPTISQQFAERLLALEEQWGDPTRATDAREKAAASTSAPGPALALLGNYLRVAQWHQRQGRRAESARFIQKAEEVAQRSIEQWPERLEFYLHAAQLALSRGEQEAEAVLELARQRIAEDEKWRAELAMAAFYRSLAQRPGADSAGYNQKAEKCLAQAAEMNPGNVNIKQELAVFHRDIARAIADQKSPAYRAAMDKAIASWLALHDALAARVATSKRAEQDRLKSVLMDIRRQYLSLLVSGRRAAEAEAWLERVIAGEPADKDLQTLQATLLAETGRTDEAVRLLDRIIDGAPSHGGAYYVRGVLALNRLDLAAAVRDLSRARDINPNNADIRFALAKAFRLRGQSESAVSELEAALRRARGRVDIRTALIATYMQERRWVPVEYLLREAQTSADIPRTAQWWQLAAEMWQRRNEPQRALQVLLSIPDDVPDRRNVLYQLHELQLTTGMPEAVLESTARLLEEGASLADWWVYMQRGAALAALNRRSEAAPMFDAAMSMADALGEDRAAEPIALSMNRALGAEATIAALDARRDPRWHNQIVRLHLLRKDWDAVEAAAAALLRADYLDALTPTQQLRALDTAGQAYAIMAAERPSAVAKAQDAYGRLFRVVEQHGFSEAELIGALNNLAMVVGEYAAQPDVKTALEYGQRAYQIMNRLGIESSVVLDTYGWMLVLNGRVAEGTHMLRLAAAQFDSPVDAHYHLGEAYLRQSQAVSAEASLLEAQKRIEAARRTGDFVPTLLEQKVKQSLARARQMNSAPAAATAADGKL